MGALLSSTDVKLLLKQQIRRFVEGPSWSSWCIKSLDSIEIEASWAGQKIREFAAADLKVSSLIETKRDYLGRRLQIVNWTAGFTLAF